MAIVGSPTASPRSAGRCARQWFSWAVTRWASSAAALLVNVSPRTSCSATNPDATSHSTRAAITAVLPVPAPGDDHERLERGADALPLLVGEGQAEERVELGAGHGFGGGRGRRGGGGGWAAVGGGVGMGGWRWRGAAARGRAGWAALARAAGGWRRWASSEVIPPERLLDRRLGHGSGAGARGTGSAGRGRSGVGSAGLPSRRDHRRSRRSRRSQRPRVALPAPRTAPGT